VQPASSPRRQSGTSIASASSAWTGWSLPTGVHQRPSTTGSVVTRFVTQASAASIVACGTSADYGPAVPRTLRQLLGDYGEGVVVRLSCPKCKHERTLRRLPVNFRCADVICDFCGYLAQVKATERADVDTPPRSLMGSAWAPQKERMNAGIYFPLFIVVANHDRSAHAVYYLPADLQHPQMFQERKPLRATARRAGWVGYTLRLDLPGGQRPIRLI
jgi:Dam-replacing family